MAELKVLLADDHQMLLEGLKSFLENNATDVGVPSSLAIRIVGAVKDGEAVLEFLEHQAVDVAVLDINMPRLDGIETARRISRLYPSTRTILLTMEGSGAFVLHALQAGIHGYVVKEKSTETLVQAIRQVHAGNKYYSPELLGKIGPTVTTSVPEAKLTERELQIICFLARHPDLTAEEIGRQLNIAAVTVQTHIRNVKGKLKMRRTGELIKYAMESRLCP